MLNAGLLFLLLLSGTLGTPLNREQDTSSYFDEIMPLIYGGKEAGRVPHMVALTTGKSTKAFFCGASLISRNHVLTAAHCIDPVMNQRIISRSLQGIVGTNFWNKGGKSYTFSRHIIHPEWDQRIVKNDIGILVTSKPVRLNEAVQTVALNFNFIPGNVATIVNGWGKGSRQIPPSLQELKLHTLDGNSCVARLLQRNETSIVVDPQLEICTFHRKNYEACKGDSGSALLLKDSKQQIGIVSWGIGDCGSGGPDVYVRISAYKSWIKKTIRRTTKFIL